MPRPDDSACRVCASSTSPLGEGQLLNLTVRYMQCSNCGYVQTERPYWLDQAYAAAINVSDTGIMVRNIANVRIVLATLYLIESLSGTVVDFAGGFGILTRLLRDYGVEAFWLDEFCENLLARGFEYDGQKAVLVTAFEVFEHFVDPGLELDRLLAIAPNVLLSTEVVPDPVPRPGKWWYYGGDHGQHIGFFTVKSLHLLAKSRGRNLVSDGRAYHLITERTVNPLLWKTMLRLRRAAPILARKLRTKTWDDHLLMHKTEKSPESVIPANQPRT